MTNPVSRRTLYERLLVVTVCVYQMEFVKQYFIIKINEKLNSFLYSHQLDFLLKYDAPSCGKLNFQQLFIFFFSVERFRVNSVPWRPNSDTSDTLSVCSISGNWKKHLQLNNIARNFDVIFWLSCSYTIYRYYIRVFH